MYSKIMKILKIESFTLLELMIVIIIIAIIGGVSIPLYRQAVRKSLLREADSLMNLIIQAEKICRLERGTNITCNNTLDCNKKLHLEISSSNWNFRVRSSPWRVEAIYTGTGRDVPNQSKTLR